MMVFTAPHINLRPDFNFIGPDINEAPYAEGNLQAVIQDIPYLLKANGISSNYAICYDIKKHLELGKQVLGELWQVQACLIWGTQSDANNKSTEYHYDDIGSTIHEVFRLVRIIHGSGTVVHPNEPLTNYRNSFIWRKTHGGWQLKSGRAILFKCGPQGLLHKAPVEQSRLGYALTFWRLHTSRTP